MFHSQYIQLVGFFSHPMIYHICDIMMSFSTWDRVHFWICILNHNSLSHQTWPTDRYKHGQLFLGIFWTVWRTGANSQVLFNLATCSNYSITNYIKIPLFNFIEKVNKGHFEMVNVTWHFKMVNVTWHVTDAFFKYL